MTTGFDTQPTTFGAILKAAPRPQSIGSKIAPLQDKVEERPREPRSFLQKARL